VVADEVRNLAGRSAVVSKEIEVSILESTNEGCSLLSGLAEDFEALLNQFTLSLDDHDETELLEEPLQIELDYNE
jgi:methyl-accepting chemotaxis protein